MTRERLSQPRRRAKAQRSTPLAEIRAAIRQRGMRSTAPRVSVLERLGRATAPLSHAEISEDLMPLGFDRATIYRNLVDLAEAGLVSRVELGDHVWRYELRAAKAHEGAGEHTHFVCNDCGTVACLPRVSVNIRPAPGSRGSIVAEVSEVLLKGRCESC